MERTSLLKSSRMGGVLRYFTKKVLDACGTMGLLGLIATVFSYLFIIWYTPNLIDGVKERSMSFLFSVNIGLMIVLCAQAAYGEARYLAILPTPRWSIYLGVVWKMALLAVASSGVAALHTLADVLVARVINNMGLARIAVQIHDFDLYDAMSGGNGVYVADTIREIAQMALRKAVGASISLFEWSGVWYLYLCLLRRWKMATLAVTIGTPILLMALLITPMVTGFMEELMSMTEAEIMQSLPLVYEMMNTFVRVLEWIIEEWPTVRAIIAACCWVLAYPVMRLTPQPN